MILSATTAAGYALVIQYKSGGVWRILAAPGLAILLMNVLANYIELALILGLPRAGEYTISRRVKRMQNDPNEAHSRRELARLVQVYLDACEPDGKH